MSVTSYTKAKLDTLFGAKADASALATTNSNVATNTTAIAALPGIYVPQIPTAGSYTYDGSGRVTGDPDGNTYTYNSDDTIHTTTKGGVTRTFTYGANGIASVA